MAQADRYICTNYVLDKRFRINRSSKSKIQSLALASAYLDIWIFGCLRMKWELAELVMFNAPDICLRSFQAFPILNQTEITEFRSNQQFSVSNLLNQ